MSLFDKMVESLNAGQVEIKNQVTRLKHRKFMEATVAVCALISVSSNGASEEERNKMIKIMSKSKELSVFAPDEITEFFNTLVDGFLFDLDVGQGEAMKYVVQIKDQLDFSQLAVRVGIAVAKSDGHFDESERKVVGNICTNLGLNPNDYIS